MRVGVVPTTRLALDLDVCFASPYYTICTCAASGCDFRLPWLGVKMNPVQSSFPAPTTIVKSTHPLCRQVLHGDSLLYVLLTFCTMCPFATSSCVFRSPQLGIKRCAPEHSSFVASIIIKQNTCNVGCGWNTHKRSSLGPLCVLC